MNTRFAFSSRVFLVLMVFVTLATAILLRPGKWLSDFDQSFYLTIAYDIVHHGVFSNGVFDKIDSTREPPPSGRFFGPVYPALIVAAMRIDPRFARAVDCSVEANHKARDSAECEVYTLPMHIIHAALLAIGVLAISLAAEMIFVSTITFWLAGGLATVALLADADLFSFVMTESLTFSFYSLAAFSLIPALKAPRFWKVLMVGCLFGLLTLTRASHVVLALIVPMLLAVYYRWANNAEWQQIGRHLAAFSIGWMAVVSPWLARNAVSTGHWELTEEYGSATLIERFAYNDMTTSEFLLAFPYCLPEVGPPLIERAFGAAAMERFVYHTPRSFFQAGRLHRDTLAAQGRLDSQIGVIAREEMRRNWWRHLLVSVPLAWCGMWVGGWLGFALVPFFAATCIAAGHQSRWLFLIYAAPAIAMLGLHAAVANQYTRYNLILIGPFSIGAAWMLNRMSQYFAERYRSPSSQPRHPRAKLKVRDD